MPSRVFEDVSADFFHYAGRDYLLYVDRLSGWPVLFHFPKEKTTSRHTIQACRRAFVELGVPVRFRSDSGPQFNSRKFSQFLKRWGVCAALSTPHYPQSNGHAEAAVKGMKKLIATTTTGGDLDDENFQRGLLESRNTPRVGGLSPAQILYGHPLRSAVPVHRDTFCKKWQEKFNDYDACYNQAHSQNEERYNLRSRALRPLHVGTQVRVQNQISKRRDRDGVVIGVGRHRDYHAQLPSGRVYWRNRRFLRTFCAVPCNDDEAADDGITHDAREETEPLSRNELCRSTRHRVQTKKLNF